MSHKIIGAILFLSWITYSWFIPTEGDWNLILMKWGFSAIAGYASGILFTINQN